MTAYLFRDGNKMIFIPTHAQRQAGIIVMSPALEKKKEKASSSLCRFPFIGWFIWEKFVRRHFRPLIFDILTHFVSFSFESRGLSDCNIQCVKFYIEREGELSKSKESAVVVPNSAARGRA